MTEATVSMTVRTPSDRASVIDIEGEVTAASEAALMDAYGRASGDARAGSSSTSPASST